MAPHPWPTVTFAAASVHLVAVASPAGGQDETFRIAGLTFTATAPGTYHYLCPVPGHARNGMTGTFTVSSPG